jgi:hypothetical protein
LIFSLEGELRKGSVTEWADAVVCRMVLGSLMGLQHRIDWKECGQSEAEEKEDAMKFKKAFAPFMPSI